MSIIASVLGIFGGGIDLAKLIVGKSSKKEDKEILTQYLDAEKKALDAERTVELEKEKPMEDQFDNVIEHFQTTQKHFEKRAKILLDAAKQEYMRIEQVKKS